MNSSTKSKRTVYILNEKVLPLVSVTNAGAKRIFISFWSYQKTLQIDFYQKLVVLEYQLNKKKNNKMPKPKGGLRKRMFII